MLKILKDKSDDIKQAVLSNERKNKFIDNMLSEVKKFEFSRPLVNLNEHKIKEAVASFCEFHLGLVMKYADVRINKSIIEETAKDCNFKIDEESGLEMLVD